MNERPLSEEKLDTDEQSLIHSFKVQQLYDAASLGMVATFVNAFALIVVLWGVVPHRSLITWLTCLLLITLIRAIQVYRYRRYPPKTAEAQSKGVQFIIGLALTGLVWGSAGIFLFPDVSLTHQVFLAFVLGGMVAGAAGVFSIIRTAVLVYSIPVLAPLIIRLFSFGDEIHITMGGMILLFAILIHVMAIRVHNVSVLSLKLRFENKSLVTYLAAANEQAEKLNEELRSEIAERKKAEGALQKHQDSLEQLVKERTAEWSRANAQLQQEMAARTIAEGLRRHSEVYLRSLIENAIDLITALDSNANILFESPSIENVFAYVHPDDLPAAQKSFTRLIREPGMSDSIEVRIRHQDGSWRFFESIGKSFIDDSQAVHIIINSRDNTERKRMEEDILKAQKLDSLGVLAGGIAHDFNNFITGVLANIELARMQVSHDEKIASILEQAERAAIQARSLTQQLLTFSRGGEPVKKTITLSELIRESTDFSLRGSTVQCTFSLPYDLRPVEADTGQLTQVIYNITMNGYQAMPRGGTIKVTGENVHLGRHEISYLKEGDYVKIGFTDQGTGIPKELITKIFDPYFTTKQNSSGLGLATAYSIVKKHEGEIIVESEVGVGTTVTLYLPASSEMPQPSVVDRTGLKKGSGRVLVMDDEEIIRDTAQRILRIAGYNVDLSKDGNEAIAAYEKAREAGEPFDVVILDLTIPGGIGGKDTIQKLIEIDPHVKAIVSSGYSHNPIMAHFREYGFLGVIAKPYRVRELCDIVSQVITTDR
jgi:PAS domain S-box-containing protein